MQQRIKLNKMTITRYRISEVSGSNYHFLSVYLHVTLQVKGSLKNEEGSKWEGNKYFTKVKKNIIIAFD